VIIMFYRAKQSHISFADLCALLNPCAPLPATAIRHMQTCEHCRKRFGLFVKDGCTPEQFKAILEGEIAAYDAQIPAAAVETHETTETSETPNGEVAAANPGITLFSGIANWGFKVASKFVGDLQAFLDNPAIGGFSSANVESWAATASVAASKQFVARGILPGGSAYKMIFQPLETTLEVDAFSVNEAQVKYYRVDEETNRLTAYSSAWTRTTPGKWTMKLSADHPALIVFPEVNCVLVAASYSNLTHD
jgi:hypothetical protein